MQSLLRAKDFFERAEKILPLLEQFGFSERLDLREATATYASVTYCGRHVAFIFSFDVRDQVVSCRVAKVTEQRILDCSKSGYSSELYDHLIRQEGYRGSPSGIGYTNANSTVTDDIESGLKAYLNLALTVGQRLLVDEPESLPN